MFVADLYRLLLEVSPLLVTLGQKIGSWIIDMRSWFDSQYARIMLRSDDDPFSMDM